MKDRTITCVDEGHGDDKACKITATIKKGKVYVKEIEFL